MRGAWKAGFWLVAFGCAACSLIVPAEPEVIYCKNRGSIGAPACPARFVCADGICDACSERDACGDGVDNDCDGVIDDGCPAADPSQAGAPAR
jgi:hypothetical protein